jgi:hypothetical protein
LSEKTHKNIWPNHFQAQFASQVSINTHHAGKNPQQAERIMTSRLKNRPAYIKSSLCLLWQQSITLSIPENAVSNFHACINFRGCDVKKAAKKAHKSVSATSSSRPADRLHVCLVQPHSFSAPDTHTHMQINDLAAHAINYTPLIFPPAAADGVRNSCG